MIRKIFILLSLPFIISLITSCGIYSLKSGSIALEVKSITINNVYNEFGGGPANISQVFTEKLKNFYLQNSRLEIIKSGGDWEIDPKIVGYTISPVAPIGGSTNQSSSFNRLTIRLQVKFTNNLDEKANFDQVFSFFEDYDKDKSLSSIESTIIDQISDRIVQDVYTKTTSNW
ncbi:MAG: hypothetical protein EAZ07_08535 [Cytophagales bacterium]|nr:MAG: hypothetical protein EAZ07_08535 [Cytophagales bacterium]